LFIFTGEEKYNVNKVAQQIIKCQI